MVCRGLEVLKWAGDDVEGAKDGGNGTQEGYKCWKRGSI
jgi:hypothetical protein